MAVHSALGAPLIEAAVEGTASHALLAEHSADIDQLVEASKEPTCDFGVDYSGGPMTMLPHVAKQRDLAHVLRADALRLLAAGDKDGAAKRTAAIFRMASQVGGAARRFVELFVAMAMATLGCNFVQENPALMQAAWKTDIQYALADVERIVCGRGGEVVKSEYEDIATWLRSVSDADVAALNAEMKKFVGRRNGGERKAAAAKLEALGADVASAWNGSQVQAKLVALTDRAKAEGIGDLAPSAVSLRKSGESFNALIGKTQATLAK